MRAAAHLIDAQPVRGEDNESFFRHNPATGEQIGQVWVADVADVDRAVSAARSASYRWSRHSPQERADALRDAARRVDAAAQELAAIANEEMGRPVEEGWEGVRAGRSTLEQYAELGPLHRGHTLQGDYDATDLMVHAPRGVVGVITPWNDPVAVPCGLLGAALVTGNTVVFKPSERSPFSGAMLGRLLAESMPPGVVNVVSGDGRTGAALAAHPGVDLVAHVGSTGAGRAIGRVAAENFTKVLLENGGKDALVVDGDVDPEWAAEQAAVGCFANAGQLCTSVERIYVHEEVALEFLEALAGMAAAWRIGPLVDRMQRDVVHRHVEDALRRGARLHAGGRVPDGPGAFYPPTVLSNCDHGMAVMREETFGPVAPVMTVGSFDEALDLARESRYGLSAVVLTASMERARQAWRELPVGTVKVNDVFGGAPGGAAEPRRASGRGFGYGPELLDEMTAAKVVHIGTPHRRRVHA
jgi:acyl-CoA reductase-like NAD-dependent aldehyde dehydrogenase